MIDEWEGMPAGLHARFASRFVRSEPRGRALAYMRGLIAPSERRNGWTPAERAGDRLPIEMQRLLGEVDRDEVRDHVRDFVVGTIDDRNAVLIGDDTGFLKKVDRCAPRRGTRRSSGPPASPDRASVTAADMPQVRRLGEALAFPVPGAASGWARLATVRSSAEQADDAAGQTDEAWERGAAPGLYDSALFA
ncbi:transposase [Streptomyces sp. NPDC093094]|uniref:transposase n=1 Tax=Streptomyces sp. NPDC093094 TaxID=3366026 RepID=UPI0037FC0015